ncbi:MAG: cupin domain-containing protein [Planctomycetota bacterium]
MLTAERVAEILGLEPLPFEGGFFRETYRDPRAIPAGVMPGVENATPRACSTQIYYMLTTEQTSSLHRLRVDEVFHHYLGDAVRQLRIDPRPGDQGGPHVAEIAVMGSDLQAGERPQLLAPAEVWQGAELVPGGQHGFALLGTTVAPGFVWEDFDLITAVQAGALAEAVPEHAEMIRRLTPAEGRTRA